MSNTEILEILKKDYQGKSLTYVAKGKNSNSALYQVAKKRDLIDLAVKRKILIRQINKRGHYEMMNEEQIMSTLRTDYNGYSIRSLAMENSALYRTLREKELIERATDEGILVRKYEKKGVMQNEDHLISITLDIMKRNNLADLPSPTKLEDLGHGGVSKAIQKYGEGFRSFRRKIREITGYGTIENQKDFSSFITKNEKVRNLAATALALNGSGGLVEQSLMEIYPDKFRDKRKLHELVQESKDEIYSLISSGITSLGPYIGAFSLDDQRIVPILLGSALDAIPLEKSTSKLEERFTYLLRNSYGPSFNENPKRLINQLEKMTEKSQGFAKIVYQRTLDHYQKTIQLKEEISCQN